jgi:nucleoside-diphosphate-sugar epimerase
MRVCVTGSSGFVGSILVPKLLAEGHIVTGIDLEWFGRNLKRHENFEGLKVDFMALKDLSACDAIIHLAAVANDPGGDLDPVLTWETNALGTMRLADLAARSLVKQFIYASSGSVYGVNDAPQITEELPLEPLTAYNKTKMVAERCVLSYAHQMQVQIVRPATVCGWSPRMRLDTVINRHAFQALSKGKITVYGGEQMRPHIHIDDMCDLYCWLIAHPEKTGIFNAGFENYSVDTTARGIALQVGAEIEHLPANDPRSYRMNSDKLLATGFTPKYRVMDAVKDLQDAYADGKLKDSEECHNVLTMQKFFSRGA